MKIVKTNVNISVIYKIDKTIDIILLLLKKNNSFTKLLLYRVL